MAGIAVSRSALDQKMAETVISVRDAFTKVVTVSNWLNDHPVVDNVDPLTVPIGPSADGMSQIGFGYTADEAYLIRLTFQNLSSIDVATTLSVARKLTGLS